ncbi:hypothetical protein CCHR01_17242 [Colletotrichum chrysophilum]|uniref:Uncharacterized protein n=1 Tax=Colletotrichum chrysophilum TaxID=1836956 RepID=A0AAD9A2M7_9PEZI|nr:hypothetical protein CCHR01_17242 [Colletotrichum chrysophilum]
MAIAMQQRQHGTEKSVITSGGKKTREGQEYQAQKVQTDACKLSAPQAQGNPGSSSSSGSGALQTEMQTADCTTHLHRRRTVDMEELQDVQQEIHTI